MRNGYPSARCPEQRLYPQPYSHTLSIDRMHRVNARSSHAPLARTNYFLPRQISSRRVLQQVTAIPRPFEHVRAKEGFLKIKIVAKCTRIDVVAYACLNSTQKPSQLSQSFQTETNWNEFERTIAPMLSHTEQTTISVLSSSEARPVRGLR